MGRAGSGGGGSRSSGGGHSSSSRSGGGHHVGGSGGSRAGSGSSASSRGGGPGMSGRGFGGPGVPPRSRGFVAYPVRGGYGFWGPRFGGGCLTSSVVLIVVIVVMLIAIFGSIGNAFQSDPVSDGQTSTIVREKLETNVAYVNDCIIDELGWFDNISKTETKLKAFWEKTGVQPYIILKAYDSGLTTDAEKYLQR